MSTEKTLEGMSGREASILRRRMLSQGKAALPRASERVRSGFREAAMPTDVAAPAHMASATELPAMTEPMQGDATGRRASQMRRAALSKGKAALSASQGNGSDLRALPPSSDATQGRFPADPPIRHSQRQETGRAASVARRRALSMGKGGLPAAKERVRSGFREAAMPADATQTDRVAPATPPSESPALSGREAAKLLREKRARFGQGADQGSKPYRAVRRGEVNYPAKVPSISTSTSNATVTGLSYAIGHAMTGAEAGYDKPLTGTQYVAGSEGGYRAATGKVGHARTNAGQTVSGTMVRSTVSITGDEDSADIRITGDADQTLHDDMSDRGERFVPVGAQFSRQSQPHGHTVFGNNLGRSARTVGSRSRSSERAVEQTESGNSVSGTAIGHSDRVTGDKSGLHRSLSGSQYFAPSRLQDSQAPETERADPASGGKVTLSQTWSGQTISGPEMEHDARVTGTEHGSCQPLTGTPYYGASGAVAWCDAEVANTEASYRAGKTSRRITGNVPLNDPTVSGTHRGADRNITGSRYFVAEEAEAEQDGDRVSRSIQGFSVSSPQRDTHLMSRQSAPDDTDSPRSTITGTFAQGDGKITGNVEFQARSREAARSGPARRTLTGAGATKGFQISGSTWGESDKITGTEDHTSTSRNPSERAGSDHGFAGATRFKSRAPEHRQSSAVTGAVGSTGTGSANVTLSGGAAG